MVSRRIGAARFQKQCSCAGLSSLRQRILGIGSEAASSRGPGRIERAVIAVADRASYSQDLTKIHTAVPDIGKWPRAELVMKVVFEDQAHFRDPPPWQLTRA